MFHSNYNIPVFSSSERLSALARFVSESDNPYINVSNINQEEIAVITKKKIYNDTKDYSKDYTNDDTNDVTKDYTNDDMNNVTKDDTNNDTNNDKNDVINNDTNYDKNDVINYNTNNDTNDDKNDVINYNTNNDTNDKNLNVKNNLETEMFTVTSAGFTSGNYSEFRLGNRILIPKESSKRGITVLYLTNNNKTFNSWNFDFYNKTTKVSTNQNFIYFLRKIPGNTYFAMSVKDDTWKNLFEGTKHFLARIIGCKTIWRLNYRNSWSAIIYKKTENLFEVMDEAHHISGRAVSKYSLNNTENNISLPYSNNPPFQSQKTFNNENNEKTFNNENNEKTFNNENNEKNENKIDNTYSKYYTEFTEIKTKICQDIHELKEIVLIQSALIRELVNNKSE